MLARIRVEVVVVGLAAFISGSDKTRSDDRTAPVALFSRRVLAMATGIMDNGRPCTW